MQKNTWSSRFNFILAATGAAVGLGAIWKFPYMTGDNGGSAFVLLSIACIIAVGIPIMLAEILLGRLGKANPITTLAKLAKSYKKSPHWAMLGIWGAIGLLLVLSFYSVIAGWSIAYIFKIWSFKLGNFDTEAILNNFDNFLASPYQLVLWHSLFMLLTMGVVAQGVQKGIEKASKIMMPGLFFVLIILSSYSLYIGDAKSALNFLFTPDFSKLNSHVFIEALGQAAFSLAVGAGCMLVYGCYTEEKTKIASTSGIIACLIVVVSLLSGLAIFPLVFQYGLSPAEGPGLVFKILPVAFNQMPMGAAFGSLFFAMLLFAAWTSSISLGEPLVVTLTENFKINRKAASIYVGMTAWTLGTLGALSFNVLADFTIFNHSIFSAMADTVTNIILPFGAIGFAVFAGWYVPSKDSKQALNINSNLYFKAWQLLARFVAPTAIIVILTANILN